MLRPIIVGIVFIALASCNPDKRTQVDETLESFKTNDATKLFFKNVRQSFYDKETLEQAKLDIYRLKKRSDVESYPVINLAIVNNWRYDEAYLLIEPNSIIPKDSILIRWDGLSVPLHFENTNKASHLKFAGSIYNQVIQDNDIEIHLGSSWVSLFQKTTEKEAFRITMMDYYRLVQRL